MTTFLNNYSDKEIYMILPKGLPIPINPELVCKLTRALYRLKQPSRAWYQRLDNHLLLQGYTRLHKRKRSRLYNTNNVCGCPNNCKQQGHIYSTHQR